MIERMLDTNICIALIRKRSPVVLTRIESFQVGSIAISAITFSELWHGVCKSSDPDRNRIALIETCASFVVLPFEEAAAVAYGKTRALLEQRGQSIGPLDTLIAGHALALDVTLVTHNQKEFSRVPGLRVESWES